MQRIALENVGDYSMKSSQLFITIQQCQVCEKLLKDRREWELSAEDIVHYGKVDSILAVLHHFGMIK